VAAETVPTAFKWVHGGSEVYVTGSFNNWQGKILMYPNDDGEFTLLIDIPPGTHHYKYIVDQEWRLDEDAPTVQIASVWNNVVEVKRPVFEYTPAGYADSDDDEDERKQKTAYGQRQNNTRTHTHNNNGNEEQNITIRQHPRSRMNAAIGAYQRVARSLVRSFGRAGWLMADVLVSPFLFLFFLFFCAHVCAFSTQVLPCQTTTSPNLPAPLRTSVRSS
jgi:hypothetical protein